MRDGKYLVALDKELLRTPAGSLVELPTHASALLVAREWNKQGGEVRSATMPFTRLAFSAIDKISPTRDLVVAEISGYGETDLICYRADSPPELRERQDSEWGPLLTWCECEIGAKLHATRGVAFSAQPASSLAKLNLVVATLDEFRLAAFSEIVNLTGSLVLGLAVERGFISPERAWQASRIDEDWQLEKWGRDEEAIESAEYSRKELEIAFGFLEAVRNSGN